MYCTISQGLAWAVLCFVTKFFNFAQHFLGQIQNGGIDSVSTAYFRTKLRQEHFDFTYSIVRTPYSFVLFRNDQSSFSKAVGQVFHGFEPILWTVILCTAVAIVIFAVLSSTIIFTNSENVSDSIWSTFRYFSSFFLCWFSSGYFSNYK